MPGDRSHEAPSQRVGLYRYPGKDSKSETQEDSSRKQPNKTKESQDKSRIYRSKQTSGEDHQGRQSKIYGRPGNYSITNRTGRKYEKTIGHRQDACRQIL